MASTRSRPRVKRWSRQSQTLLCIREGYCRSETQWLQTSSMHVQRIPFCKSPQCTPFHVQRIPFCKSPQCVPFCAQVSRAMGDDDDERHLRNDGKLGDFIVHVRAAAARRRDAPGPIPAQALRTRRQSTNVRNACAHRARSRTSQAARRCGPRAGRKRAGRAEGLHAC